jgi:hypothetical protein
MAPDIFAIHIRRHTNALGLPVSAVYTVDAQKRKRAIAAAKATGDAAAVRSLENDFQDGMRSAEYSATFGLFNGSELPMEAELSYRLDARSRLDTYFIRIIVTNATFSPETQRLHPPVLPNGASVSDQRTDFTFRYTSTNGAWLDISDLPSMAYKMDPDFDAPERFHLSAFARYLIGFVIVAPICFYCLWRLSNLASLWITHSTTITQRH